MRFWSHCKIVTCDTGPKLISSRLRAPLMYTVLSVLCPIMLVFVLILVSAAAGSAIAAASRMSAKRFMGFLQEDCKRNIVTEFSSKRNQVGLHSLSLIGLTPPPSHHRLPL